MKKYTPEEVLTMTDAEFKRWYKTATTEEKEAVVIYELKRNPKSPLHKEVPTIRVKED